MLIAMLPCGLKSLMYAILMIRADVNMKLLYEDSPEYQLPQDPLGHRAELYGDYISIAGLRLDGRRPAEIRRLRTRIGIFERVDGSAYLEQGNTKVIAHVYGPREIQSQTNTSAKCNTTRIFNVSCEYTQAAFSTWERKATKSIFSAGGDRKNVEYAAAIERVFGSSIFTNLYPQSEIRIFIQVLHADGGELAASINAATLALINAGIAMHDFVIASTVTYVQQNILLDFNSHEEVARGPQLVLALHPQSHNVAFLQMESKVSLETFEQLMNVATDGCDQIYEILQNDVRENTISRIRSRGIVKG